MEKKKKNRWIKPLTQSTSTVDLTSSTCSVFLHSAHSNPCTTAGKPAAVAPAHSMAQWPAEDSPWSTRTLHEAPSWSPWASCLRLWSHASRRCLQGNGEGTAREQRSPLGRDRRTWWNGRKEGNKLKFKLKFKLKKSKKFNSGWRERRRISSSSWRKLKKFKFKEKKVEEAKEVQVQVKKDTTRKEAQVKPHLILHQRVGANKKGEVSGRGLWTQPLNPGEEYSASLNPRLGGTGSSATPWAT